MKLSFKKQVSIGEVMSATKQAVLCHSHMKQTNHSFR